MWHSAPPGVDAAPFRETSKHEKSNRRLKQERCLAWWRVCDKIAERLIREIPFKSLLLSFLPSKRPVCARIPSLDLARQLESPQDFHHYGGCLPTAFRKPSILIAFWKRLTRSLVPSFDNSILAKSNPCVNLHLFVIFYPVNKFLRVSLAVVWIKQYNGHGFSV